MAVPTALLAVPAQPSGLALLCRADATTFALVCNVVNVGWRDQASECGQLGSSHRCGWAAVRTEDQHASASEWNPKMVIVVEGTHLASCVRSCTAGVRDRVGAGIAV